MTMSDTETCDFIVGTPDLAAFRQSDIRTVQSTPLVSRSGRVLGMISHLWRRPYQPSERNLRLPIFLYICEHPSMPNIGMV
jgi:hypothetical protein